MPSINAPTPDATSTSKGKIQLAGDLAGTASAPIVVKASVLGYAQITATASTTNTAITQVSGLSTTVTIPSLVGNQRIEIEFYCRDAFISGGGIGDIYIVDGTPGSGTVLQTAEPNTPNGSAVPVFMKWSGTSLSAGNHTINIAFSRASGTAFNIEAGATFPSFLQVKVV